MVVEMCEWLINSLRVARSTEDYQQVRFGQGPIAPFKSDLDHMDLLEIGLSLGSMNLTAEELAACFDELCPCGKTHDDPSGETHDPDTLKKQLARLKRDIEAANEWILATILPRERFAVYGSDGIAVKAFRDPRDKTRSVLLFGPSQKLEGRIFEDGTFQIVKCSMFAQMSETGLAATFSLKSVEELFAMFFPRAGL